MLLFATVLGCLRVSFREHAELGNARLGAEISTRSSYDSSWTWGDVAMPRDDVVALVVRSSNEEPAAALDEEIEKHVPCCDAPNGHAEAAEVLIESPVPWRGVAKNEAIRLISGCCIRCG